MVWAALEAMAAGTTRRRWSPGWRRGCGRSPGSRTRTICPGRPQVTAKDALVRVAAWADDADRQQIDGYLIDWYCVASYEDRAKAGANLGPAVMRLVGPPLRPGG